jgi:deferrochelatase/peroxidase EfeB
MSNALVTIIAPLDVDRVADAEATIDRLQNPARPDIRAALDRHEDGERGTHFASLHAIRSQDGKRAYIVLEFSADGAEDEALARIERQIGDHLRPVFMQASDWKEGGELLAFLRSHRVTPANGWFGNPGVVFAGTPGLTVGRIQREAKLAGHVARLLSDQPGHLDALARVDDVRRKLAAEPEFKPALLPAASTPPFEQPGLAGAIASSAVSLVKTYLWPVGLVLLAIALAAGVLAAYGKVGVWAMLGAGLTAFLGALWTGFWIALLLLLIAAAIAYASLRKAEDNDSLEERTCPHDTLAAMFERENQRGYAQNHMISVTQRKPGAIRWFTSRLVFWIVGEAAAKFYRPGFLSDIGTIHFARWVTTPGGPDVLFFSNYDSSWESYLEDFITRAHAGLTAIWSNSVGFPRSENLIQRGATDGERFKRYARQSMVPTRFWYSAYPALTTTIIRSNAEVRRGLSGTMTEDEAIRWLALFGSAARPATKLVSSEIQSLVFGGLGFLHHGTCLIFDLPDDVAAARKWLAAVMPHVAFNDGRRLVDRKAVVTLALGARGLKRLGLPEQGLATFPFAFLEGMTPPARARILGDIDSNGADYWTWGRSQPDVALLIYGEEESNVLALAKQLTEVATQVGMAKPHEIPLKKVSEDKEEPFGFVDGISQPVIRGTYKGLRNADPIHLVEAGEFILGYPDNRGNMPPGPTLPALADPDNQLPLVGAPDTFDKTVVENDRDLGFNGTFLVIRQLEQNVDGFWEYCEREAERLKDRLPPPYEITGEFIAAKLIGRWPDGSSLVRYQYESRTEAAEKRPEQVGETMRARTARAAAIETPPKAAATHTKEGDPAPATRKVADNDFLFGAEDPEALRCPFGAHIRRSNPRDSFDPGSNDQIAITNRHRIMRVGRVYEEKSGENPGLLFMCLNGDIERQFEFVQQTWLMSPSFHGLSCEKDPVLGDGQTGACGFTIASRHGPIALNPMPAFVSTKGGGYFFLPGKRLLEYLCAR